MCIERLAVPGRTACRAQRGVSLVELIVFISIVSVALAGVLSVLNTTAMHSAEPMVQKQMLAIAEGLLDEVEMMPFSACDPVTNTNPTALTTADCLPAASIQQFGYPTLGAAPRSNFNNVGNYCSNAGPGAASCTVLTLGSASTPIPDLTGSTSGSPAGYWATIALTSEALWGVSSTAAAAGMNVLRITVTVHHDADSLVLESYRTRWSPAPLITP